MSKFYKFLKFELEDATIESIPAFKFTQSPITFGTTDMGIHWGTLAPTSDGFDVPVGSAYINTTDGAWYLKTSAPSTGWATFTSG